MIDKEKLINMLKNSKDYAALLPDTTAYYIIKAIESGEYDAKEIETPWKQGISGRVAFLEVKAINNTRTIEELKEDIKEIAKFQNECAKEIEKIEELEEIVKDMAMQICDLQTIIGRIGDAIND